MPLEERGERGVGRAAVVGGAHGERQLEPAADRETVLVEVRRRHFAVARVRERAVRADEPPLPLGLKGEVEEDDLAALAMGRGRGRRG